MGVSYDTKVLYIHAKRRHKKRSGPNIKKEYRLELSKVNGKELAEVIASTMGPVFQDVGVEIVIADNDRKAHAKAV